MVFVAVKGVETRAQAAFALGRPAQRTGKLRRCKSPLGRLCSASTFRLSLPANANKHTMPAFRVTLQTVYQCSLERAFKTPMLCDVSKIHTGFGLMPRVTHCTEDASWGKPGGSKRVFAATSLTFAGGEASMDRVLERIENEYWKIEVSNFTSWMLGSTNSPASGGRPSAAPTKC